ncbi:FtsX-like permease family protein [Glycomyces salinus]|uniref:FtsX-like permease family protein n=1 Tax=Glycomyces salinus TaxID=980294 RepID=UPI0018EC3CF7|nr:ABC transporter permease [Glycomyces salinus]
MARKQVGGLVAVFCAVFGAAALATATGVVAETGLTSHLEPERLAAADVLISAPQRHPVPEDLDLPLTERVTVPAETADEAAAVPGVAAAVADVSFPASVEGADAPSEGHSWASAEATGADLDGEAPTGPGEVVAGAGTGAETGQTVTVATASGRAEYTVTGTTGGPGLYFEADTAAELSGLPEGEADLIAVALEPGSSAKEVAADLGGVLGGGFEVTTGEARGDVERIEGGAARGELVAVSGSLAGTIMLLCGFITAGALAVSVANQRRDLALLRAVGATPKQVRRLVATQATVVAAVAVVPGGLLGYPAADGFARMLADAGMLPGDLPLARSPLAALAAALLMLATVQIAARCAAWRTSRLPATTAVAESRTEPKPVGRVRTTIGLVLLALAMGQALMPLFLPGEGALASAGTGTLTAVIGLALAGPALVKAATALAASLLPRRSEAPAWLAEANTRAYSRRTAGAVTVLALAIALTVMQVYSQTTVERAAAAELEDGITAETAVSAPALGTVPAGDVDELAALPGVDAAVPVASTTVIRSSDFLDGTDAESFQALVLGPGAEHVADPRVAEGSLADLEGEAVAVAASTAFVWGVAVGDEVDLVLADGREVSATVVATYERGFGFGSVIASSDLVGPGRIDTVLVSGDGSAVADWAAGRPGLEAGGAALGAKAPSERWINVAVTIVLLGYVLLGVGNSLVAATVGRRGEFASLRMAGATPRQVRAMMRRETAILSAIAVAAGLAISVLPMSLLGLGLAGRPWPQGPPWVVPAAAALAVALAFAATGAATRKALSGSATGLMAAV